MRLQPSRHASLFAACALLCLSAGAWAQQAGSGTSAPATATLTITPDFTGDDPVAVRDALARKLTPGKTRTFAHRVEDLVGTALPKTLHDSEVTDAKLSRDLAFVVPAPYGIRYRSKIHVMTVDVGLSDSDHPDAIVLKKTVTGPRGRKLVVAAEAKAKGYIQNVDLIELDTTSGKHNKTSVRGHFGLSEAVFEAAGDGDLALVLICRVVPPYLTESVEHSDPTNEEPTDITTRTATLHANVGDIWLINREKGVVLAKGLHLVK
jgi:hypothetical protein